MTLGFGVLARDILCTRLPLHDIYEVYIVEVTEAGNITGCRDTR